MKACMIQPNYSLDYTQSDAHFEWLLHAMDQCDPSMDIIVLPEGCDTPCYAGNEAEFFRSVEKYNAALLEKAAETARRCHALLFINGTRQTETGPRNTTYAFNRQGEIAGCYYKQHLVEKEVCKLDNQYTYAYEAPTVLELDGLRFGFLTCYDFYFYEAFANMARQKLDIIIGCSQQRSDSNTALELFAKTAAYNCNAYVLRASFSLGENSPVGGATMVVAPDGSMLLNMHNQVGMACVEFDPMKKYIKPMGFGNGFGPHYQYIEAGRRPWKYRPAGSAIVLPDARMPYPRVCSHRGFNTIAPENSLPAFGAAVALGAEEIEFDLWATKDGEIVSLHDSTLDRVSDGTGRVWDHTYDELRGMDFGSKKSEHFRGLKILKFEDILKKFACHVVMNIHVKTRNNVAPYNEAHLKKIVDLIRQYDCEKYCYFMTANYTLLRQMGDMAPEIARCAGADETPLTMVDRAIELGCQKVQLFKPHFTKEMIERAHAHGIICNVFWSDDPEETKQFLDMGIDVILSNDYLRIARTVEAYKAEHAPEKKA